MATGPRANNAFTVLMANARESKEQVKGKGKGKATVPKSTSSSYTGLKSSKPPQKRKKLDQGKAEEVSPSKPSLKSKMKPKMAPKPKPKPPLPVIPSPPPEVEKEPSPPPSSFLLRSPSPARPAHSARSTTPLVQDVSMESIGFAVEPDVPMKANVSVPTQPFSSDQATPAIPQAQPAGSVELDLSVAPDVPVGIPGSESHVFVMEDVVNRPPTEDVRLVADADVATSAAHAEPSNLATSSVEPRPIEKPVDPPQTKPTSTKVHISTRKPSSIPAPTRITRSVSLKRNQKVSEVPEAPPTKATGKQVLPKKSLTTLLPDVVASGSLSKSSDEVPPNTVPSTSNSPSLSTESAVTLLLPGSPMKLDHVQQNTKTRRSSFAQPTKSALTKQVSPKKLSFSKPRGSSPNKLGRSVSMVSRPRG